MVVRKKQGGGGASKTGPKKDEEAAEDANQATGLSLDEYFNSKKAYTLQTMKETSELLEKKEAKLKHDNAMVMSKDDEDASAEADTIPVVPMHDDVDTEEDPYEDDYESDHGAELSSSEPNLVAGLTLSDYLTGAATTKPKEKAKKGGPSKKVEEIEGMSLESYLGATSSSPHDDDRKKKKKPPKIAAAPSIADKKIVVHQPFKKKTSAPNAGSKKLEIHSLKKSDGDVLLFKRDKAHMDKALVHNPLGKNNKHVKPRKKDTDDDSAMAESHLFHPLPMLTANKSGSLDQPVSISDDDLDISRLPPLPH